MDKFLSVYQYPTLTVLVDDSRSFLDSLDFQLNPQMARKVFSDTQAALDWLHHAYRHADINPVHASSHEQSEFFERHSTSYDLGRIYRNVLNRKRFDIPTVLVIDYAMPQMDGMEFCRAVQDFPCKKILLTGQADEKIAIEAFNKKLIDRYIKKNAPDSLNHLEAEIMALQQDFFMEQTAPLSNLLSREYYAFLSDPAMSALVRQLCSRYRFVEYHLFPHPTGILFLDVLGKATLMVIETVASLVSHIEVAQDQNAPAALIAALKELRLVPFFSDTGGMYESTIGHDWLTYCLPAQVCQGRQHYYWALFDLPPHYLQGPVYSYAEFLREQGR